jgi:carbamoyltransferase
VSLGGVKKTGLMVPHHMSHAASAYYTSDRDSAALYTLDNGVGYLRANGYSGGIYAFGQGNRLAPLAPHYDYHGQFYQRVGEYLDLGLGGAAGKLMGLAPYGEARFFDPCMIGNAYDVFDENYAQGRHASASKSLKHFLNAMKRAAAGDYNALPRRTQHHVADAFGARDVVRPNIDCAMTAQREFSPTTPCAPLRSSRKASPFRTWTPRRWPWRAEGP